MFDIKEVKQRSGTSFARGRTIFNKGELRNVKIDGDIASATVYGQHAYQVVLHNSQPIQNSCTCPASDYQDFCKHCVALALAAEDPNQIPENNEDKIQAWLEQLPSADLANYLMDYIRQEPAEIKRWVTKQQLATQGVTPAEIKKMVTKALPKRGLWEYHKVKAYFDKALSQFNDIDDAMLPLPAEEQLKLAVHAIDRLESVLLKLDDSGGYRASLEMKIFEMMTRSFSNLDWDDGQKVDWLIKSFEQDSEFGIFPTIPADFNLTSDQLALFYAKCEAKLSGFQLEKQGLSELSVYGLSMILIERAEALGEWREVVRLKGRIADQYFEFLGLCEICLAHDEEFDAEDWLMRAKNVAADGYELTQCAKMEVKVLVALDDIQKAWDLAWGNYVKRPELDAYKELESMLSGINGSDFNLFEQAQSILISGHKTGQTGAHRFGFYSELLALYIHLKKWDLAIAWFDDEQGAVELALKLAQSITGVYPETSGRIYMGIAAKQVATGSNRDYQEAAKVLRDAENHLLETNQGEAIMKVIVASLVEHYKHKRNMMLMLSNEFSSYCP